MNACKSLKSLKGFFSCIHVLLYNFFFNAETEAISYIHSGLDYTKPVHELNTISLVWLITIFSVFSLVKCVLQAFDVLLNNFLLLLRALRLGYLTQDMIDDYEPALMFTIPRLAIVW